MCVELCTKIFIKPLHTEGLGNYFNLRAKVTFLTNSSLVFFLQCLFPLSNVRKIEFMNTLDFRSR